MRMSRNIVICLDGTGNQFNEHNTNVVKLFRVLVRDTKRQVAFYDPGVGTLGDPVYKTPVAKKIDRVLGLAFGRGLTKNVMEAYSYLMEQYQDGDNIFLFGFSRGAYTARVLAGFIHHCGLLEAGCQNLIPYAMKLYTKADREGMTNDDWKVAATFRKTYGRKFKGPDGTPTSDCCIHFLGLWDSVSTLGWVWDPVFLPHTKNHRSVAAVRHAIAIDERRVFFRPLSWGLKYRNLQDIKEVWFAGVHSDVGGGYPEGESGLAKITLEWMIREATAFGLVVDDSSYQRYVVGTTDGYVAPAADAQAHRSLKGLWWTVELMPKTVWNAKLGRKTLKLPHPAKRRVIPVEPRPILHKSVLKRMEETSYTPPNLPSLPEIRDAIDIED